MMQMPLIIDRPKPRSSHYDVVSLNREDDHDIRLRFMARDKVGRQGSREITLGPEVAEALLNMLMRELDSDSEL